MAPLRLALATLLAALVLPAALAHASPYTDVLKTYETQGTIPPCRFTSTELERALKGVNTFGAQYGADFIDAIQSALTARAAGQCAATSSLAPTRAKAPSGRDVRPLALGPVTAATSASLPAPILLMAVLGGIVALIGATGAIVRLRGWELGWPAGWRHAWGEAGYRARGAFAELAARLRSR